MQDEDIWVPWDELKSQRIRWKTPNFVKRGTVRALYGRSIVVDFDAHEQPTVIPDGKWYFVEATRHNLNEHLVAITTPAPQRSPVALEQGDEYVSPREAASILGDDPKNVRRRIRNGSLKAHRIGGRWVVKREDL